MAIWNKSPTLELLNNQLKGNMCEHVGIEITAIGDDHLVGTLPVDERTVQPMGLLHGGANVVLAETLGSIAANLACENNQYCVGLEINANHLKSATSGKVTGTARPIHLGRSTQVWEIRIEDEQGALTCISRLTMAAKSNRD
ncbi:hotdog fold thioesterase [Endozoicomonas gorgoniicola]|uniref:Hotdog fold thioesterase n=1 Tax=Endozoicomonas gorgoniicola TaxID=1234144 RepID=A0ABT3N2C8_9GAMM|nr:hotdog fold thioesterase [Endozoicomonas gorgoniicola]MCW7555759.1 hotdog fold thioesterase [Endozoicomonas gorgoniicola]